MSMIDAKLHELGITLPTPAVPVANYVPFVKTGTLLFVSGQVCFGTDGKIAPEHTGHVGANVTQAAALDAARFCAINVLAQVKAAVGDLDRVVRCVRLGGFISSAPEFTSQAAVMNGASDLIVAVLGDKGRHARTTIGVAALPLGASVEVEAIFEVEG